MFSCDEGTVPDGMKPASNTDIVDYYLYVPEEWIVSTAERASTQAYASKSDRTNILVMQWNWITTDEIKPLPIGGKRNISHRCSKAEAYRTT